MAKRKSVPAPGARRQQGISSKVTPVKEKPPPHAATIQRNKDLAMSAKGSMTFKQVMKRLESRKR
jgi:hypothetical protein